MAPDDPPSPLPRRDRPEELFRYAAVVNGAGEIQPILEFIGRRLVRRIDPRSATGRRLLAGGRVRLWCETIARGERMPVRTLLRRLRDQALREREEHSGGPRWDRACRHRLETIAGWESFYGAERR